ncbi:MAG: hypothetical protein EZS28_002782 [Streblomastix strix]|uniref:Uncharacterized protein n=1 Tax=Streblomastix strix TaxID=222440 RepID=A0A5J4X324_9EUKA|nr:MAG: hypothetical protein EZS28_002782 [Streblomastix strix]
MRKCWSQSIATQNSNKQSLFSSSRRDILHNRHQHHQHRHIDGEIRKEIVKIVGVLWPSKFDPNKMEPKDCWRRSAELKKWQYKNLLSISESREMQSSESSHVYADCARAVSLAESMLIAEIHQIIPNYQSSRYQIDACLMCPTAGACLRSIHYAYSTQGQTRNQAQVNYRSTKSQSPSAHDNVMYYSRCDNYIEKGRRQTNDNQRASNCERRVEKNHQ